MTEDKKLPRVRAQIDDAAKTWCSPWVMLGPDCPAFDPAFACLQVWDMFRRKVLHDNVDIILRHPDRKIKVPHTVRESRP